VVESGFEVVARVVAHDDEPFPAEVYFISPTLEPESRRLPVKAWVSNRDQRLRPGMFATVELATTNSEQTVIIPESAIAYDSQGSFVWRIMSDQLAERAAVVLGPRRDGQAVIRSGLSVGDTVVTSGTHKVYAGGEVQVRFPDVAAAID
jgi:membrane fusion protein (multidrug efflux system)